MHDLYKQLPCWCNFLGCILLGILKKFRQVDIFRSVILGPDKLLPHAGVILPYGNHSRNLLWRGIINLWTANVLSRRGQIKAKTLVTERVAQGVVFMPFHFIESNANVLTNPAHDPIVKIPEYKVCAVRVEKA